MAEVDDALQVRRSRFLRQGGLLFVATVLSNGLVFLGFVVASRVLGPDEYGVVAAMFGLVIVLTIPSLALQTLIAREVATALAAGASLSVVAAGHQRRLRPALAVGAGLSIVIVALAPVLQGPLGLGSVWPIVFTGLAAFPILVMAEARGVQQGRQQFAALGLNLVVEGGARLAAIAILLVAGFGATGVTAAPAIGTAVAAVLALSSARDLPRPRGVVPTVEATGISLVFFAGFAAVTNLDVVVANRVLTDTQAGEYGAAALFGRVVLLAPIAIGVVLVPKVIEAAGRGRSTLPLLGQAVGAVAAISGVLAIVGVASPELVRLLSVGGSFSGSDAIIRPYGIVMFAFAVLLAVGLYNIALSRSVTAWASVVAVPLQLAALLLVPSASAALVSVMAVTAAVLLALGVAEALAGSVRAAGP